MDLDRKDEYAEALAIQIHWVRRLALDLVRDTNDAEDLVQETMLAGLSAL